MHLVESSMVAAIGYDSMTRELHVRFHGHGRTYVYKPVDLSVFNRFLAAPSKGDFFLREVKERYIYRPLDESELP